MKKKKKLKGAERKSKKKELKLAKNTRPKKKNKKKTKSTNEYRKVINKIPSKNGSDFRDVTLYGDAFSSLRARIFLYNSKKILNSDTIAQQTIFQLFAATEKNQRFSFYF
jgi:hypothetical protein